VAMGLAERAGGATTGSPLRYRHTLPSLAVLVAGLQDHQQCDHIVEALPAVDQVRFEVTALLRPHDPIHVGG
jgi:hypothetical protein